MLLKQHGLTIHDHIPLWGDVSEYNQFYLETKVEKAGHIKNSELIIAN